MYFFAVSVITGLFSASPCTMGNMLLVKNLGIDAKRAQEVLNSLAKYHMVRESQIEMDDEVQTIYYFVPTPSFVALLIFAHEIINVPNSYMYYTIGRNKPYLK